MRTGSGWKWLRAVFSYRDLLSQTWFLIVYRFTYHSRSRLLQSDRPKWLYQSWILLGTCDWRRCGAKFPKRLLWDSYKPRKASYWLLHSLLLPYRNEQRNGTLWFVENLCCILLHFIKLHNVLNDFHVYIYVLSSETSRFRLRKDFKPCKILIFLTPPFTCFSNIQKTTCFHWKQTEPLFLEALLR
jgi:hypothetical protein